MVIMKKILLWVINCSASCKVKLMHIKHTAKKSSQNACTDSLVMHCIACTLQAIAFFACAASQGSFHRYFDCSKACDALAEEAVVWICTCVSGLQILLRSSYVIAARLLLRNQSLIALLKIRTEQEFKKTPQICALLLRAWGTVFYEFARNGLFPFS